MLGRTLRNHYQIIKFLGKGGFGHTYLAKDLDLPGHPQCVVKHLKPQNADPALLLIARRLFEAEAQTLYKLGKLHDQIPKLSAHFEENGEFYLVQDFIAGHDLTKELIPGKKLSESYTITLLHNILEILAIVHQQKVIHRDLKPDNLMRRQDGKIILIDFGAVKEISTIVVNAQKQTSLTIAIGTPGYMPSEQAKGKPRFASDIHAVGMIGIQALTGEHPHNLREDTRTGEVIWRNQAQVSNNLANVLDKMVRDNFSQRYQNADEALQAILSLSPPRVISTNTTRRTLLLQFAGLAGVGLVGAVLSQNLRNNKWPKILRNNPSPSPLKTVQFETVTVNSTGQITKRSQSQAKVFTETIAKGITLEMMAIPGGRFVMGSPNTEARRGKDEGPQHTVNVTSFFMGKYEVTQEQWQAVMGNNPSYFKGAKLPVEQVSWNDAVQFCQKLSEKTGKNYRLPSEAEWEYACHAGTTTPFYFGETITPDLVNYGGNYPYGAVSKGLYRAKTTDVGSFPPNAFGLYDMHGNVYEWCSDRYHSNYNGAPTDGTSWETGTDDNRVQRGGSWFNHAVHCRAAGRIYVSAGFSHWGRGFRVAVALAVPSSLSSL